MYITDGRGKKGRTSDVPQKGEQDYNKKKKETTTTLPCVFHGFSNYRPWRNSSRIVGVHIIIIKSIYISTSITKV